MSFQARATNFHLKTTALFKLVNNELLVNSIPDYISYSGSKYWYRDGGVYRYSNHWGIVKRCRWYILYPTGKYQLAYCGWSDFSSTKLARINDKISPKCDIF